MEVEMTRSYRFVPSSLLCLLAVGGVARAQGFSGAELDRMSKQRMQALPPRNYGPPPPQSTVPVIPLHPSAIALICMGVTPYQPILAKPAASAVKIGTAVGTIATTGVSTGGYSQVLYKEGVLGYVPATAVHAYRNEFNPVTTCSVQGLRSNGVIQYKLS
jgi:hypothetical protein